MNAIEIRIVMAPNGEVQVSGPLDQEILMRGIISKAQSACEQHWLKVRENAIQVAQANDLRQAIGEYAGKKG